MASSENVWEAQALCREAEICGLRVSLPDAERLVCLLRLVWASPLGLTAIRSWEDGRRKHLLDSLAWLPFAELAPGETLVDVGSGAGFPGIPAAVVVPEIQVTLLEANRRRCAFLRNAAAALGLANVAVCEMRAEQAARSGGMREHADCIVARAVAPMSRLVEYLAPLCRVGGRTVMLKGPRWREEWADAARVAERVGLRGMRYREYELPEGSGMRAVVLLEKGHSTPRRYPRRARHSGSG